MCVCLAVAAYLVAVKRGYKAEKFPGWQVLALNFASAIPGLLTAVIIVGGVLSGVFTVTESGAFGAMYALVVTLLVYRSLTWESFKTAVVQSVRTTSMVMILIACAGAFAYMLTFYRVPSQTVALLQGITENPILILLMINAVLLMLGMIMDMAALILICTPIFLPVANSLGMDPLQFGMMLLVNLGLGLCTPPVGTCLFVGCAVWEVTYRESRKDNLAFLSGDFRRIDADHIRSRYLTDTATADRIVARQALKQHCKDSFGRAFSRQTSNSHKQLTETLE